MMAYRAILRSEISLPGGSRGPSLARPSPPGCSEPRTDPAADFGYDALGAHLAAHHR